MKQWPLIGSSSPPAQPSLHVVLSHVWFISASPVYNNSNNNSTAAVVNPILLEIQQLILPSLFCNDVPSVVNKLMETKRCDFPWPKTHYKCDHIYVR